MNEITTPSLTASRVTVDRLVGSFLSGRKAATLRAYSDALADFAAFCQCATIDEAARRLFSGHPGDANALALDYQNHLREQGLSPASVNQRLSALRSLVKLARMLGLVTWQLEVRNVAHAAYRDTHGPGKEGVMGMLGVLDRASPKGARDAAIIRLLFDRGLRRGEVASLDMADIDAIQGRIRVLGKGRAEAEWLTIPPVTLNALADWLIHRGLESGPLFINLDRAMPTGRLSGHAIYDIVSAAAKQAGLGHVRPHGLRHAAITHALDKTNGNIRATAKFARHKRIDTTALYDDNRRDVGGQIARLIAAED